MTVSTTNRKSGPFNCNGATTVFLYEFRILDATHLRVVYTSASGVRTDLSYPADYSVQGAGSNGGGTITTVATYANGSIVVLGNAPLTQDQDFQNQGAFFAEDVESALDLNAMRAQDARRDVDEMLGLTGDLVDAKNQAVASAASALASMGAAQTSETNAAGHATAAQANKDAAALSAASALESKNTAAGSQTGAAGSAVTAEAHKVAALAAATSAGIDADAAQDARVLVEQLYNAMLNADLGGAWLPRSATNPTTRGDGSPLVGGEIYYNTAAPEWRRFDGVAWTAAYGSGVVALPIAGGVMQGPITLPADPSANMHSATKQYVDNKTWAIGNVTSLQTTLDGKAAAAHTHTIANVTGLQGALDGKAASSHTHAFADLTSKPTTLNGYGINDAAPASAVASGKNAYGDRTVSTSDPSGGNDGDIWLKVDP